MIDIIFKSSLILGIAAICAAIFNRQSAAVRHVVWTVGLISALVAPVCTPLLPSWPVQLPPAPLNVFESRVVTSQIAKTTVLPAGPMLSLTDVVFYGWLTGVVIAAAWLFVGALRLAWLAIHAEPVGGDNWKSLTTEISQALHLGRSVRLLKTDRGGIMGAWGIIRGHVLLPRDAESWSDERIRVVLIHELAHIKRNDWLMQTIAECARAVYWFNPLFWLLSSRLRRESEHSCDDIVLGFGIDGKNYAGHLLELARALKNAGAAWSAVLAMAQRRHLERRFQAMLNPMLNHRPVSAAMMILIVLISLCVVLPLAAIGNPPPAFQAAKAGPPEPPLPVPTVAFAPPAVPAPAPPPPPLPARPIQVEFGSFSGTAYDPSGAVIAGVTIAATNLLTKAVETTTSNASGDFSFSRLPAGDYSLQADLPGFATLRIGRIAITASQNTKQNLHLVVGNVTESVIVKAQGPPKPATLLPADTPRRIRVGGNVVPLRMINNVRPVYPASARNAGIEGTVSLQAMIGADGSVQAVRVLSSIDADLTAAALEAVKQWRYLPTLLNGVPVETLSNIDVQFTQPQQ